MRAGDQSKPWGWIRARVSRSLPGVRGRDRAGLLWLPVLVCLLFLASAASPKPDSSITRLGEAREYWERGKTKKALAKLEALQRGDLADHVALVRATWLLAEGRLDEAQTAAERALALDPPPEVASRVRERLARIHIKRGDLVAAYRAQRSAWEQTRDSDRAVALMMELAAAFESSGRPGQAFRLYGQVWERWPVAEGSDEAFETYRRLARGTGAPAPSAEALLKRAERQSAAFRCEAALRAFDLVLADPKLAPELGQRGERGRADCLFGTRRYPEAARAYRKLLDANPTDYDVAIRRARSHARAGKRALALKELNQVVREAPLRGRSRARYLLAVLEADEAPERARTLLRAVQKQRALPGLARRARWELAWAELRKGAWAKAIERLAPLAAGSQWDIETRRARYWSAIAKLETEPKKGRAELKDLAETLPLSYYGLIAAQKLGSEPEIEHSFVGERGRIEPERPTRRAAWLLEAGFDDQARAELDSWMASTSLSRTTRVEAARLLHQLGDHSRAVRVLIDGFGGTFEQGIDPDWRDAWHLAWPQPFNPAVRQAVAEFGFDSALVYAVMREESTYRPKVQSPAGAIGLMQIIPPTADRIAQTLGVRPFAPQSLLDPRRNIRFGTYYLKDLKRRFSGSAPLAIAAYNAGPEIVTQWLQRDGNLAEDVFVESVPYGETRRYLRKVLRSYHVYQLLYGVSQPEASLLR